MGKEIRVNWQPIKTAPRTGEHILIASKNYVMEARWWPAYYGDKSDPGWMPANLDEEYGGYMDPTHWMPMPEGPR